MSSLTLMWKHKLSGSWILTGLHMSCKIGANPKKCNYCETEGVAAEENDLFFFFLTGTSAAITHTLAPTCCLDFWDLTSRIFQRCRELTPLCKTEWKTVGTIWRHESKNTSPVHCTDQASLQYIYSSIMQNKHFAIPNTEQMTRCYVTATSWQSNCTAYCATVVSVSLFFPLSLCCVYTVSVFNIVCF